MKKVTKKTLTALVAIPVAAVLLTGCGATEVPSALDGNPFSMPARSYSTETVISNEIASAGGLNLPVYYESEDAYIASVRNKKDGTVVVTIENFAEGDNYFYDPENNSPVALYPSYANYEIRWYRYEENPDFGTLTIEYWGADAAVPTDFKFLNTISGMDEDLYLKMVIDSAKMYNFFIDSCILEGLSREEAIAALAELNITEDTSGIALEMAEKGDDFAVGVYAGGASYVAAKVGDYMYLTQMGPEYLIYENSESNAIAQVWEKILYSEGMEEDFSSEYMPNYGVLNSISTLEEAQAAYTSTGYEILDGKVYYYEEFFIEEEGINYKFYFNNDELIYFTTSGLEGVLYEFYISSTIPERLFRTECPTGYLDYTGRADF